MFTFQAINQEYKKDHETADAVLFIRTTIISAEESWNDVEEIEEAKILIKKIKILAINEKGMVLPATLTGIPKGGKYYVSEGPLKMVMSGFNNKQAEAILAFETGTATPMPINPITKKEKALLAGCDDIVIATITAYKTLGKKPNTMETKIHEKLVFLTGRTNLVVQKITKTRLKEYFGGNDQYKSGYYVSETQFEDGFLLDFATDWMKEAVYLDRTLASAKKSIEKVTSVQEKITEAFNLVISTEGSASDEEIQEYMQNLAYYTGEVWVESQNSAVEYSFTVPKDSTKEEIQAVAQKTAFEMVHFDFWPDKEDDDILPKKENISAAAIILAAHKATTEMRQTHCSVTFFPSAKWANPSQPMAMMMPMVFRFKNISTNMDEAILNPCLQHDVVFAPLDAEVASSETILGDRTKYLGASEFGSICGVSKFDSPIDVYMRKVGLVSDPVENAVMKRGKQAEAYIGKLYEERTGHTLTEAQKEFIHPEHDFLKCHVDWLDQEIPVDAKSVNVNRAKFERDATTGNLTWGADGTDEVSHDCIVQAHGQMLLTGAKNAIMAVLFIDDDVFKKTKSLEKASSHEVAGDFRIYKIDYNQDVIDFMLPKLFDFWHNHILPQIAPPFDFSRKEVLKKQVRVLNDIVTDEIKQLGQEEEVLRIQIKKDEEEVRKAQKALNEAKARLEANQARLEAALGNAQQGIIPNIGVYTRKKIIVKAFTRKEKHVEANNYIKTTFTQQE